MMSLNLVNERCDVSGGVISLGGEMSRGKRYIIYKHYMCILLYAYKRLMRYKIRPRTTVFQKKTQPNYN